MKHNAITIIKNYRQSWTLNRKQTTFYCDTLYHRRIQSSLSFVKRWKFSHHNSHHMTCVLLCFSHVAGCDAFNLLSFEWNVFWCVWYCSANRWLCKLRISNSSPTCCTAFLHYRKILGWIRHTLGSVISPFILISIDGEIFEYGVYTEWKLGYEEMGLFISHRCWL